MAEKRITVGKCQACGYETRYAWVDMRVPDDNPIFLCISCVNEKLLKQRSHDDEYVTLDSVLGRGRHEDDSGIDLREEQS